MSFQAMAAAVLYRANNATEKLVLILVSNYADRETNACFPSQTTIAEDGSMSTDSVGRALRALANDGAIIRNRRMRDDGSRTSDEIIFNLDGNGVPKPQSAMEPPEATLQSATLPPRPKPLPAGGPKPLPAEGGPRKVRQQEEPSTRNQEESSTTLAAANTQVGPATKPEHEYGRRVWVEVPQDLQTDSNKRSMVKAFKLRIEEGADVEQIITGTLGYYRAKAKMGEEVIPPNRVVGSDMWSKWMPRDDVRPRQDRPPPSPASAAAEDSLRQQLGTKEAPGPRLQQSWMEDWVSRAPAQRLGFWSSDRGPPPGAQGCRVSAEVQAAFGVEPHREGDGE